MTARAFPPPQPNGSLGWGGGSEPRFVACSVGPKRPHRATGEQNANARLTWATVRAIRADAAEGCRLRHIAWWHSVNPGTVFKIINNLQWIEVGE